MDVLVLGGTSFVGRAIVEDLLVRGHTPTLFSRGRTGTELFPGVERLLGDRDTGDYAALDRRRWDAVVDVTAYVPRHVEQAVTALDDHAGRYVFISTGLVYNHVGAGDGLTETTARVEPYRESETIDDETYGPLKAACEEDLEAYFGDRLSVIRPGWVVGPHDPHDRLTYWLRRAARGGPVALPSRLDRPVQVVDVRDLARLVVVLLESDRSGAYNAVGPAEPVTLEELVRTCGVVDPVELSGDDLDLPLLLPDASWDVMQRISAAAAYDAGMPRTPLARTVADTRAWDLSRGEPPLAAWMSEAEEAELLKAALGTA
ncbi:NAD-dependent epimerase/dehydratase family protein [Nocardioides sp.]|uniref:NAD-dependent epimerase/dehydratase family protein n=1 Tax=Nocardioides sp. TaxID=35761 RepID=UPI0031FEBC7B|nr:NAD-dependent epimerase/dehydratase family protein [Nocardioides sp.]